MRRMGLGSMVHNLRFWQKAFWNLSGELRIIRAPTFFCVAKTVIRSEAHRISDRFRLLTDGFQLAKNSARVRKLSGHCGETCESISPELHTKIEGRIGEIYGSKK
jgi:hypothetical protein